MDGQPRTRRGMIIAKPRPRPVRAHTSNTIDYQSTTTVRDTLTLTLIPKLPPEILCRIFRLCAPTPFYPNLAIAQVCSRWRTLILNDPSFWRSPIYFHPQLSREMVVRAKGVPLVLDGEATPIEEDSELDAIEFALRSNPVEYLNLSLLAEPKLSARMQVLAHLIADKSQHTLRHLRLDCGMTTNGKFLLPDGVSCQFPELRELHLAGCMLFPWKPDSFSKLAVMNLGLRNIQDAEDVGICVDVLVGLLAHNPHLERISLSGMIKPDPRHGDTSADVSHRSVRLERLSFLRIYDNQCHLLRILPLLDLPSLRNIEINQWDWVTSENQVEPLLQAILDKLSHLPMEFRDVRRLEYSVGEPANVCIAALLHTQLDPGMSPAASERSCHIVFSLTRSSPKWNEWSGILTKMFTLRRLQQLRVGCTDHRNNNNRHMLPLWKSILFQTSLKELSVEHDILQSFWLILAEALPAVSSAGKVDDEALYAFPSLTVLEIHMTDIPDLVIGPVVFEDAHSHGGDHQQKTEVRSGVQLIQTWSKRRPGGGALTLKLSGCSFPVPGNANASYMVNVEMQIVDGKVILPALTARSHSADNLVMEFLRDNVA